MIFKSTMLTKGFPLPPKDSASAVISLRATSRAKQRSLREAVLHHAPLEEDKGKIAYM